jgi:methionine biosynthesis protein MetW
MKIPLLNSLRKVQQHLSGPMPLQDFSDYDEYWNKRKTDDPDPVVLHRSIYIASRIPAGSSVLDIGCGDGAFLAYLKQVKPTCDLFGVDLSEEAILALEARGVSGAVIRKGETLKQMVGRDFENVVLMEVIEHVHDAEELLAEALALNPSRIFITIPNAGYIIHRARLMFGGRFPVTAIVFHVKEHIRFWTVKDFYQWADYMGCEILSCIGQERTGNKFKLFMMRLSPALFAGQLIFELRRKGG